MAEQEKAIVNAAYGQDFFAVRQQSVHNDELFMFKHVSHRVVGGNGESRDTPPNCWAMVVGVVEGLYPVKGKGCYVRLKCPENATCGLISQLGRQTEVLKSILDIDHQELGGTAPLTFFDCTERLPTLKPVPGSFYVWAPKEMKLRHHISANDQTAMEVAILRRDSLDTESRKYERRYRLHVRGVIIHEHNCLPVKPPSAYVCDRNGTIGCELCVGWR